MTREEARTALGDRNNLLWGMSKEEQKYYSEALDMAISALSSEGEYIKKEDAIVQAKASYRVAETIEELANLYEDNLNSLPTYSFPEREKGEWILTNDEQSYVCSCCHNHWISKSEWLDNWKFCPNCGADMRGDNNE